MADNLGILSILECPVCLEYMIPPIFQCQNQHLICSKCHTNQTRCPICRGMMKGVRNLCMEKVTEYISYPCKNDGNGCNAMLRLDQKEHHEKICLKSGQYRCLLPMTGQNIKECLWIGPFEKADAHIRQTHSHLIKNSNDGSFNLYASEFINYQYYILFDDNLFCVLIHKDPLRTSCVQKVYTFFFHITSVTCTKRKSYAYNVNIEGHCDTFEGFVGKLVRHTDIKDMACRNECHHFMGNDNNFAFKGNIAKI